MPKKILISGINGSGGSYLAEHVATTYPEVEIHGLSRWHSSTNYNNLINVKDKIILHESDLLDLSSLLRIFKKIKPDIIFNLASHANVRVCFDNPIAVLNNNIISTANLLEAVKMESINSIFLQCSTSEIYGNPVTFPMTEEHPMKPVNPYSVSKLAQESLAFAYYKSWKLKVVITRAFAYINPRRKDLFASNFAMQIAEIEAGRRDVLLHGNLESIRTIIDVRDMMRAYWIACDLCEHGTPYNIGGKTVLTVGQVLDLLKSKAKVPIQSRQDKNLLRPIDVTQQVPDTTRFDNLTNFKPQYSIDESLEWLLDECRKVVSKM